MRAWESDCVYGAGLVERTVEWGNSRHWLAMECAGGRPVGVDKVVRGSREEATPVLILVCADVSYCWCFLSLS